MKAVVIVDNKTVKVEQKPIPDIKPNELLFKVVAAGLNPTDWKSLSAKNAGNISGCDFVGVVTEIGSDVPPGEVKKGETRWAFIKGASSTEKGAFAEYTTAEWDLSSVVPPNITPQQAASAPIPYLTAVQALYLRLRVPEPPQQANGEWILIWSGNTSVGRYAIQLAKLSGLKVATTASESSWSRLKSYGANLCVDYKDPDVVKKLKEGTNDSIIYGLDCYAEKGSIQQVQLAFSAKGGHLVVILFDIGDLPRSDVKVERTIAYVMLGVDHPWGGSVMKSTPEDRAYYVKWAKLATKLFSEGKLKPLDVDIIGNLDSVQTGFDKLRSGKHTNKLVVLVD